MALPALVYNRITVRLTGNFWCLTDMWRATGSDPSKTPAEWLRSAQAKELIEFLTMGISHSLVETIEGRGGGTWADRRIAISYAKYLAVEFHAKCNEILLKHYDAGAAPIGDNQMVPMLERVLNRCLDTSTAAHTTANQALATADRAEKKADKALKLVVINKNPAPTTRQDNIKLWREAGRQASSTKSKHQAKYGVLLEDYGWSVDALRLDLIAKYNAGIDRWGRRITSIKDLSLDQMDPNGGFDYRSNHEWVHRTSNSSKQDKTLAEYSQSQMEDEPELPL